MEIHTEDYRIYYDAATQTIFIEGRLRLRGTEDYAPIVQLLNEVAEQKLPSLTLNLQKLEFLNSSGIGIVSKFVIKIRKLGNIQLTLQASKDIAWQEQSLPNLKRLLPSLHIAFA